MSKKSVEVLVGVLFLILLIGTIWAVDSVPPGIGEIPVPVSSVSSSTEPVNSGVASGSCSVIEKSVCVSQGGKSVMGLSALTNAHGQEFFQIGYNYVLCCDYKLENENLYGTSCGSPGATVLKLSKESNAHAEVPEECESCPSGQEYFKEVGCSNYCIVNGGKKVPVGSEAHIKIMHYDTFSGTLVNQKSSNHWAKCTAKGIEVKANVFNEQVGTTGQVMALAEYTTGVAQTATMDCQCDPTVYYSAKTWYDSSEKQVKIESRGGDCALCQQKDIQQDLLFSDAIDTCQDYSTNVCYQGFTDCISGTSCQSGYTEVLSLSKNTNAHIAEPGYYDTKICCALQGGIIPEPKPIPSGETDCVLTSASWGKMPTISKTTEGTTVSLFVEGENCDFGEEVIFYIGEDDTTFTGKYKDRDIVDTSEIQTNLLPAKFAGTTAMGAWIAEWHLDTDNSIVGDDDPEYVFKACLKNYPNVCVDNSGELKVTKEGGGTGEEECEFITAYWSNDEAVAGEKVILTAKGTKECEGQNVNFDIIEFDMSKDYTDTAALNISQVTGVFTNLYGEYVVTSEWTAEWVLDEGSTYDDEPEYIFEASLVNNPSISIQSYNELEVSQPTQNCAVVSFCTDYNSPGECAANNCNKGLFPTAGELFPGTNVPAVCGIGNAIDGANGCDIWWECGCAWDEATEKCVDSAGPKEEQNCGGGGVVEPECPNDYTSCLDSSSGKNYCFPGNQCPVGDEPANDGDGTCDTNEGCTSADCTDGDIDNCEDGTVCSSDACSTKIECTDDTTLCSKDGTDYCYPANTCPAGEEPISDGDGVCDYGEGCTSADCIDGDTDTCVTGATCQSSVCSGGEVVVIECTDDTTLCSKDGTDYCYPANTCPAGEEPISDGDGVCDYGEGCTSADCIDGDTDTCVTGTICSNGACSTKIECLNGYTLCNDDGSSKNYCFPGNQCPTGDEPIDNNDGVCDYGEGCASADCENGDKDSCVEGTLCQNGMCTSTSPTPWTSSSTPTPGTCLFISNTNDNCEDDGFLEYSWNAKITWPADNSNIGWSLPQGCYNAGGSITTCKQFSDGWHYDPIYNGYNALSTSCIDNSKFIQCPSQSQLPFFGIYSLIMTITLIGLIYAIRLRKD